MRTEIIVILLLLLSVVFAYASHDQLEKVYQDKWCSTWGGVTEYRLDDGARIDCLTDEYAIEFDFAPKWAESIGQSLFYAYKTDKKPAVALIIEHPKQDQVFIKRLNVVAEKLNIKVFIIKEEPK